MIQINLLPFRLARKTENIRRQVSVFFLTILLMGVALVWLTLGVDKQISETKARISSVQAETRLYKERANRVTVIKKQLKVLEDKLKIVASLKTKRNEQQVLLEEMADRIVKTRMWIESLKSDEKTVVVTGVAYDNPTIADFMRNLEKSSLFSSVDLEMSKLRAFEGNVSLKAFSLLCTKIKPVSGPSPKKGKK